MIKLRQEENKKNNHSRNYGIQIEGVVVGLAEKSFTVAIPEFALNDRIYLADMEAQQILQTSTCNAEQKKLDLTLKNNKSIQVRLYTKILVALYVRKDICPIDIKIKWMG